MVDDIVLEVPLVQQARSATCGLAALAMVLRYHGFVGAQAFEAVLKSPMVPEGLLRHNYGFGPGRLGRIALSYTGHVELIDPNRREVGKSFVAEGGIWVKRPPRRADLEQCLREGIPPIACIPDKSKAFEGVTHRGSHWVVIRGIRKNDFLFHDPAPWAGNLRCRARYWDTWRCSLLKIHAEKPPSR